MVISGRKPSIQTTSKIQIQFSQCMSLHVFKKTGVNEVKQTAKADIKYNPWQQAKHVKLSYVLWPTPGWKERTIDSSELSAEGTAVKLRERERGRKRERESVCVCACVCVCVCACEKFHNSHLDLAVNVNNIGSPWCKLFWGCKVLQSRLQDITWPFWLCSFTICKLSISAVALLNKPQAITCHCLVFPCIPALAPWQMSQAITCCCVVFPCVPVVAPWQKSQTIACHCPVFPCLSLILCSRSCTVTKATTYGIQ